MIVSHAKDQQTTLRAASRRRGVSLLEVILAFTILALAMGAIGELVDLGTDRGNDARAYNKGAQLAQSKMAEVESGVVSLSDTSSGQFPGDDSQWSYTVSSQAAGPPNLYTVTVNVSTTIQGRTVSVALTQMLFDPTKMGSAVQAEVTSADGTTTGSTGSTGTSGTRTGGTSP